MSETLQWDALGAGIGRPAAITVIHGPNTNNPKPVNVQWAVADRMLRVSKTCLTEYLTEHNIPPHQIVSGLKTHFKAKLVRGSLGAGTRWTSLREYLYEVPVPEGSILEPLMLAYGNPKGE